MLHCGQVDFKWVWIQRGVKESFIVQECLSLTSPSCNTGLCRSMPPWKQLPPLGGSEKEKLIHIYTLVQTVVILLMRCQDDCSLRPWHGCGSWALAVGYCTWDLHALSKRVSDALSECNTDIIILSTADFIGPSVGCRNVFIQLSCRGGLDLRAVVPIFVHGCVWLPDSFLLRSVTCGGASVSDHASAVACLSNWNVESDD